MPTSNRTLCLGVLVVAVSTPVHRSDAGTFYALGDLPGGSFSSTANEVSADGTTVVGAGSTAINFHAFRWTLATGMVDLGTLPPAPPQGSYSSAADVSADGSVVVGQAASQAFRWTQSGGMVGLGFLDGATALSSASGVSADGTVIAGTVRVAPDANEAYRWTQATGIVGLGMISGSDETIARDLSADGSTVVGEARSATNVALTEPILWTQAGGMIALGTQGFTSSSRAWAVSADGSVVVGEASNKAFLWTQAGGLVNLPTLPGLPSGVARAVTADGSIVIGTDRNLSTGVSAPFIWDAVHGTRNLLTVLQNDWGIGMSGWGITPLGISADGLTIVGSASKAGIAGPQAFIATYATIPEPGTFAIAASGGLLMLAFYRWK